MKERFITKKYTDENLLIQDINFKVIAHIVDFMNTYGWVTDFKVSTQTIKIDSRRLRLITTIEVDLNDYLDED